jgi:tRNA dimethylallyltransferase
MGSSAEDDTADWAQPALVIGGPTASGKTGLAISLAQRLGGDVINGDAFQLYAGLPVLTAQPSAAQRALIPHHLFGEIPLSATVDAATYARLAKERIRLCWKQGRPPILVGGSGLYLRTVLRGLPEGLPSPDPELRARLEARPLQELCAELSALDPEAARNVDLQNPRRVIRALEVCLLTGRAFSSFRPPPEPDAPLAGIWLALQRETLHERIALRAAGLFAEGVAAEVEAALPSLGTTARQVIGLEQVASVLAGETSEQAATLKIVEATRQYARRQETWFRKEAVLSPSRPDAAVEQALRIAEQKAHRMFAKDGYSTQTKAPDWEPRHSV